MKHVNLVVKLTDGVRGVSACAQQIRRWKEKLPRGENSPPMSKNHCPGQKSLPWAKGRPRRPFCTEADQPVARSMLLLILVFSFSFFPCRASTHCLPELLHWLHQCRLYTLHLPITRIYLIYVRQPARFTPSPGDWARQLNNLANSKLRDDNFLEQRCWILQQWECK